MIEEDKETMLSAEEKALVEGEEDWVYLDWLDQKKAMLSDEDRVYIRQLIDVDPVYINRMVSKAMIEAMLRDKEKAMVEGEKDRVYIEKLVQILK